MNFFRNNKGISYVEILTVTAIIMVMSFITLANIRGSGKQGTLFIASQKVITDIRRAQNNALSAMEFEGDSPAGGWGIYFKEGQDYYTIFADKEVIANEGDHVCHSNCGALSEEDFLNISIPDGLVIDKIYKIRTSDNVELPATQISITFEPPEPTVHICEIAGDCEYDKAGIVLVTETLEKREVTVNFFGLVDTKEAAY